MGSDEHPQQFQPFEKEIASILEQWRDGVEGAEAQALMSAIRTIYRKCLYAWYSSISNSTFDK